MASSSHTPLPTGAAIWRVLQQTIHEMTARAPANHDILIQIEDVRVLQCGFLPPDAFLFYGLTPEGREINMVVHYTQLKARCVYLPPPKPGQPRVITGFNPRPLQ